MKSYYPKERWTQSEILAVVISIGLVLCFPLGIILAIYNHNSDWLWLCAVIGIFLT